MWKPHIKATNINNLIQMIFSSFGYFVCTGYFLSHIILINHKCLDLINIDISWAIQLWNIIQWEISKITLKRLLIRSVIYINFSINSINLFCIWVAFLTFLEIKIHMPKIMFISIFSDIIYNQNYFNFDQSFLFCIVMCWYDNCYNTVKGNPFEQSKIKAKKKS